MTAQWFNSWFGSSAPKSAGTGDAVKAVFTAPVGEEAVIINEGNNPRADSEPMIQGSRGRPGGFGSVDLAQDPGGGPALTVQEGDPPVISRANSAAPEQEAEPPLSQQEGKSPVCGKETSAMNIHDASHQADPLLIINRTLEAELAAVKRESQESIAGLKRRIGELEAQWELEKQGLLEQVQQVLKAHAMAERKAAYALGELQKRDSMRMEMSPTAECEAGGPSEFILAPGTKGGVRVSECQPEDHPQPEAGAPEDPRVTPEPGTNQDHGGFARMPSAEGLHELHRGITAFVGCLRKGLLDQGLYSLAELLDGSRDAVPEVVSASPQGISKAEMAPCLHLLGNATAVFNRLLEGISYKYGAPPQQEEAASGRAGAKAQSKQSHSGAPARDQNGTVEWSSLQAPVITREQKMRDQDAMRFTSETSPHTMERPLSILFTHIDEMHNRRVLEQGVCTGRVPLDLYQDASVAMASYSWLRRDNLTSLLKGYIQQIAMKKAEKTMQKQNLSRPEIGWILRKFQKMRRQAFQLWRERRCQNSQSRLQLALSLDHKLRQIEGQSGMFLIKPLLPCLERSPQLHSERINAHLKAASVAHTMQTHPSAKKQEISDFSADTSLGLSGISFLMNPLTKQKEWNCESAHANDMSVGFNQEAAPSPMVITPQLLVMDVNRYLREECRVSAMSQSRSGASSDPKSILSGTNALQNFIPVTRTSQINLSCSDH
ncbi:uncharacterized protein LOC115075358 [Rhinatrema bivittatum]|uniref:uncharacterized protein LOC115075358 n=1 Tax=Rhinatrema bivittatum TaxID=194408 RepID=UPI00112B3577|nr:uncharacterized protein LOC115075358 [Rhinatrema bivittatum]